MTVSTLSFLFLVLFMVHEFEEIIFMHYWLDRHQSDPKYKNELWISQYSRWPATRSSFAFLISEEFMLAILILFAAILLNKVEIVIGMFLANMIHLIAHLVAAKRIGKWSPGSVAAPIALILSIWI